MKGLVMSICALVVIGAAVFGNWSLVAGAGVVVAVMAWAWPGATRGGTANVEVDANGVRRVIRGQLESVGWSNLVEVAIATTSDGPYGEDLYWMLVDQYGKGCAVPGGQAGELMKRLQRLPRFDNVAVVKACGCTDDAWFTAWKGEPGEALVCSATVCSAVVDTPPPRA
jgi:hypothetical protein